MAPRDIALALSGGGYRAAYFHLGALRRLKELGLLERLGVISSVSGGSIVAAAYVLHRLRHQDLREADSFDAFLQETRAFLDTTTLDAPSLLAATLLPFRGGSSRWLEHGLRRLYGDATLAELEGIRPRLVLNTTAMHSGRGWRFLPGNVVEEWEVGSTFRTVFAPTIDAYLYAEPMPVARAVAASAAFPVFSAVGLERKKLQDHPRQAGLRNFYAELPRRVYLADGGITDNTGLLSVLALQYPPGFAKDYYLIGSDASAVLPRQDPPSRGRLWKLRHIFRSFDIRGSHNGKVVLQLALFAHHASVPGRGIALFSIGEKAQGEPPEVFTLARVETRLRPPDWNARHQLMDHGAALLWHRLSQFTPELLGSQAMPGVHPERPRLTLERGPAP